MILNSSHLVITLPEHYLFSHQCEILYRACTFTRKFEGIILIIFSVYIYGVFLF